MPSTGPAPRHRPSALSAIRACLCALLALALGSTICPPAAAGPSAVLHPGRSRWSQPDYAVYHTMEKLLAEVEAIVSSHPDIMKMEVQRQESKGYATDMQVVTVEPGGLTDDHSNKIRVLLDFGEHARELVSSETGLALLRLLTSQILPMENTGGRRTVERGNLCERKNGRGVDPNRNYVVHWGVKERDYDPKEEYPGEHPLSEPEALIVQGIVHEWQPHVWVNVHSGMEALFMPFDHQAVIPPGAASQAQLGILKHLNKLICGNRCAVGSGGKSVGYLAHGTATDHMYLKENVPLSFTWEIYGDMKAHYLDCFRMFNPLTQDHLDTVVSAWVPGFLYLVAMLPAHPITAAFMEKSGIPLPPMVERVPQSILEERHIMAIPPRLLAESRAGSATGLLSLPELPSLPHLSLESQPRPAKARPLTRAEVFPQLHRDSSFIGQPEHSRGGATHPVNHPRQYTADGAAAGRMQSRVEGTTSGAADGSVQQPKARDGGGQWWAIPAVGLSSAAGAAALLRRTRLGWYANRYFRGLDRTSTSRGTEERRER